MSQNTPVPESDQPPSADQTPAEPPASDPPVALAPTESPAPTDDAGARATAASAADSSDLPHAVEAAVEAATEAATEEATGSESAPKAPAIPDLSPAACAALLAERFPALFGVGRALPIKLRIQADIQQRAPGVFNKKSLSIFLHRHTTSTAYIKALVNSPQRIDLDGQPAGDIAQEHKDAGITELQRRLAIVQARRVAERDAQRAPRRGPQATPATPADALAPATTDGDAAAPTADSRPPRPPRADRPPRPPRPDMQARPERGPRPPGPASEARGPRPDRAPRAEPSTERPFTQRPPVADATAAPTPLTPEQAVEYEARRGRAALLRAFESTTLTAANFCALKGLKVDALNAALEQARQERGPVAAAPAAAPRPNPGFAARPGGRRP